MKKNSKILLLFTIIMLLLSSVCFATDDLSVTAVSEQTPEVTDDNSNQDLFPEWIYDDLYTIKDNVNVNEIVDGNAFIIGSNVTISGEIGGDVFVIADTLTIDEGMVYSSIFALANKIYCNGAVYDIYAICNNFNMGDSAAVLRDLRLTCDSISLNGIVRRNAYISAKNFYFEDNNETTINGNLIYSSPAEVDFSKVTVSGEITYNKTNDRVETKSILNNVLSAAISLVVVLLFTFVVTLLATVLTPKFVEKLKTMKAWHIAVSLPIGIGSIIIVPILLFLLMFSVVGLLIGLYGLSFYFLMLGFSFTITSMLIAAKLLKALKLEGRMKFVLFSLLACLILWVLNLIPFVGVLVYIAAIIVGCGTVVFNLFRKA